MTCTWLSWSPVSSVVRTIGLVNAELPGSNTAGRSKVLPVSRDVTERAGERCGRVAGLGDHAVAGVPGESIARDSERPSHGGVHLCRPVREQHHPDRRVLAAAVLRRARVERTAGNLGLAGVRLEEDGLVKAGQGAGHLDVDPRLGAGSVQPDGEVSSRLGR